MKTLSNTELQDAIMWAVKLIKGDNSKQDTVLLVHLENLTDEQRKRATDEVTLEPMEPAPGRVDFDARVRGQGSVLTDVPETPDGMPHSYDDGKWVKVEDGPEWVEWGGSECPVPGHHLVDLEFRSKDIDLHYRVPAKKVSWGHMKSKSMSESDVIRYRDWTAWEQSK